MQFKFHTLDVFTTRKFAGNPLAVVLDADALSTQQMQTIAGEFNLPETTFIQRPNDKANTCKMRIFTPRRELPFAGHPTIGSAVLIAELQGLEEVRFELNAGLTPVKIKRGAGAISATLTAPVIPFACEVPLPSITETAAALNLAASDIGFDNHFISALEGGPRFFFVPVNSSTALAESKVIEPAWSNLLGKINEGAPESKTIFGAYLYTRGGEARQTAYRARMFAPGGGITEDPATGSATALLAAQLHRAEAPKDGTHIWQLEQGYEMGRPSQLQLEVDVANNSLTAVRVAGSAVRVCEGVIAY